MPGEAQVSTDDAASHPGRLPGNHPSGWCFPRRQLLFSFGQDDDLHRLTQQFGHALRKLFAGMPAQRGAPAAARVARPGDPARSWGRRGDSVCRCAVSPARPLRLSPREVIFPSLITGSASQAEILPAIRPTARARNDVVGGGALPGYRAVAPLAIRVDSQGMEAEGFLNPPTIFRHGSTRTGSFGNRPEPEQTMLTARPTRRSAHRGGNASQAVGTEGHGQDPD
jgi:hypothetical protein